VVVTGSEHPSVIRNIYFELVHTVRLDNAKSHAYQWQLQRTQVVLSANLCPECRTSVVLVARRPFSGNMSKQKLPAEWKNGTGRLTGGPFAAANCKF
jgi:hypothetical protein